MTRAIECGWCGTVNSARTIKLALKKNKVVECLRCGEVLITERQIHKQALAEAKRAKKTFIFV